MRRVWLAVTLVFAVIVLFAAVTLIALEGREVVVLRTFAANGAARDTRTWVAEEDGALWIEAANASRPFLLNIDANPEIELQRGRAMRHCHAVPVENPDGHARIRRLLAEKYGWADRWIGWLTDTSRSLAIRLQCR
jgi:F420H(2)-dependent quinone reductase